MQGEPLGAIDLYGRDKDGSSDEMVPVARHGSGFCGPHIVDLRHVSHLRWSSAESSDDKPLITYMYLKGTIVCD